MDKLKNSQNFCEILMFYICILLLVSTTSGAQQSTSNQPVFNGTCTRDDDCRVFQTYLRCSYHRCFCRDHEYFDKDYGLCRIKVPSQCHIKRDPVIVQPCIRDAYCAFPEDTYGNELRNAAQGTCKCVKGKFLKPDGLCSSAVSNNYDYKCSFLIIISYLFTVGVGGGWNDSS